MSRRRTPTLIALAVVSALTLAACGSSGSSTGSTSGSGGGSEGSSEASSAEGWQTVEISDTEGNTYTIESLQGTPVFVENFATWCGNCRNQLGDTQQAAAAAGDDAIFLALSIETDLDTDQVSDYAKDNGFDNIRFAVMSPEMLAAMDNAYGKSALNAPSTPKIVVAADGTAGELKTGFESPDEIAATLSEVS